MIPPHGSPGFAEMVKPRLAVCFLPGTDPDTVAAFEEAIFPHRHERQASYEFDDAGRWPTEQGDPGEQGAPRHLTWSLIPDGVLISEDLGNGCTVNDPNALFSRMDALFASQGGRATWIALLEEVFERWSELTGTSYTRLSISGQDWDDGAFYGASGNGTTRGDVRISLVPVVGGGSCNGVLAFNFFPGPGEGGDMTLNFNFNWGNANNGHRLLRNVVAHEHGHGLGVFHVCPVNGSKLMEPFLSLSFDGPQHDDLRAVQRGYGDPFEPSDSTSTAIDLGTISVDTPVNIGTSADGPLPFPAPAVNFGSLLSIDADSDIDFFRFTIDQATLAQVSLTPVGDSYDSSPQGSNGVCTSGNIVDSNAIADLNVQILDGDDRSVLATAADVGPGGTETLSDIDLTQAGDYFILVYTENTFSESQLYELDIFLTDAGPCQGNPCDDGLFCNGAEVCVGGACFAGTDPCPGVDCDDDLDVCVPGVCCLPDGGCDDTLTEVDCVAQLGSFHGAGTRCSTFDPPCERAATRVTCRLSSPAAVPDSSVDVNLFVENVPDLASYELVLDISTTAGSGMLAVPCPAGARIDSTRPDYVFAGLGNVISGDCNNMTITAQLDSASVSVGDTPAYVGTFTLDLSADAVSGTSFDITILPFAASSLHAGDGSAVPFSIDPPCSLTAVAAAECTIATSDPMSGAIDARAPLDRQGADGGWAVIGVSLSCGVTGLAPGDFSIAVLPDDGGPVPVVDDVISSADSMTLELSSPVPVGKRTIITYVGSGDRICVGRLPADANGDGSSSPFDILTIIDDLNGVLDPPLEPYQCDINHTGECNAGDILKLIDLLVGAGSEQAWQNAELQPCP